MAKPLGQVSTGCKTAVYPPARLSRAVDVLRAGGRVAMPTETVYGLAADACSDAAVASIYAAKDRPSFNPLIAHMADLEMARRFVEFSPMAERLAHAFWPGPLTLVLPKRARAGVSDLVTAGLETLAVRVPAHPVARDLIAAFGGPLAAPSANPSGKISPTTAAHVLEGLSGRIEAVLDAGACGVGVESTILGVAGERVTLLRPGGLSVEDVDGLGITVARTAITNDHAPNAPGQLTSHYAPDAPMRLNVIQADGGAYLAFGPVAKGVQAAHVLNLSESGDLAEASANLFAHMRSLDALGEAVINVAPVPMQGLGLAINDRLSRAAAPKAAT